MEVDANLNKNPDSDIGIAIGKRCMEFVNALYGKKHIRLRNAIWEKGFKEGLIDDEPASTPEVIAWLDKAISAYYGSRISMFLTKSTYCPHQQRCHNNGKNY